MYQLSLNNNFTTISYFIEFINVFKLTIQKAYLNPKPPPPQVVLLVTALPIYYICLSVYA